MQQEDGLCFLSGQAKKKVVCFEYLLYFFSFVLFSSVILPHKKICHFFA